MIWLVGALLFWIAAWALNVWLANSKASDNILLRVTVPVLFGVTLLVLWEGLVRGLGVSQVILPAPSQIGSTIVNSAETLWVDFNQTVLKGALRGFVIGAIAAFVTAIIIDRSSFLTRGLLPISNFVAALPIVGIAPILVNWFGLSLIHISEPTRPY